MTLNEEIVKEYLDSMSFVVLLMLYPVDCEIIKLYGVNYNMSFSR